MKTIQLGNSGIDVATIGLGCMGLAEFYGPATKTKDAVSLMHQAIDLGVNHFDTAQSYGVGSANEKQLGTAFSDRREAVVIATKWGPIRDASGNSLGLDGSPENCRRAVEDSLKRLQTDYIDLYYLHRRDPNVPIADSVGAMADLVQEGKIRAIGLSEVSAETLKLANEVHPIAALQSEYSIFSRDIEIDILPMCEKTGTTLVAYSPLGRGMLTGAFKTDTELGEADFRRHMQPRFVGDAYHANVALVNKITAVALELDVTPGEVALAWVLGCGDFATIPGTTKLANLQTNLGADTVLISEQQKRVLDQLANEVQGNRYDANLSARLNG